MKYKLFTRLLMAVIASLFLVAGTLAQDKKTDNAKKPQTPPDTSASPSGLATTQITGVITSVNRHDGTTQFEIKLKDSSGKKHEISVSPSAVIKQGDQKVAATTLQKGANVQVDAYTTPSGSATAKTITITAAPSPSK